MQKVGILTQPLEHNYGGILQAYALSESLKSLGHEPLILDRRSKASSIFRKKASWLKSFVYNKILFKQREYPVYLNKEQSSYIYEKTRLFIDRYLKMSEISLYDSASLKNYIIDNNFKGVVVGSDQVWRPAYSPQLSNYFFDFLEDNDNIRKISYAASFGVDKWEFSEEDTIMAKRLAPLFDAISVREDSGVVLCNNYLGINATHVLDPTLLLSKDHYIKVFQEENEPKHQGTLFSYVLDPSEEKQAIVKSYEVKLGLKIFKNQPQEMTISRNVIRHDIESLKYPSVTSWIRSFYDAEFVITDSFHGCVFSIIFNKPFIAIVNEGRGASRFHSLLKTFGLENRVHGSFINADIDWDTVNSIHRKLTSSSLNYIKKNVDEE